MASAPEVVHEAMPQFSTLPQVSPFQEKQVAYVQDKEALPNQPSYVPVTPQARSRAGWWSSLSDTARFVAIAIFVILAAVIIGTVVGVVVNKKANRSPTPSSSGPTVTASSTSVSSSRPSTPTPTSVCRGTFCPSMLSVVQDSTPSAPSGSNFFFALGQDKLIWYRRGDGVTWFIDWTSLESGGLEFQSQPDAVTFVNNQTNIWVVDSTSKMQSLAYKSGVWDSTWLDLGGSFTTPMTSCSRESEVIDIFGRASDGTPQHMSWNESDGYSDWQSLTGFCASSPFVACGNDSLSVVVYGGYQAPFTFDIDILSGLKWSDWQGESSNMKGDPFAMVFGPDRSDYFGIGTDGAMYYTTWTSSAGYGPLQNLGGSFESTPFAFTGENNRVDVLAVGVDDQLNHKALIGGSWSSDWDDLGGSFNSAPVAFYTPSGLASVFGLANNGSVFHGTWTVGSAATWTCGNNWTVDGGAMATTWFRGAIS
ncbi:hypothetical protein L207DRAFT_515481 [Hyaloscypha variabilis F]|uniref:PLL-like beta propeller domain-containing protein n=1 Tax=Hyaloscypha variabilis (strain UAMH 11265 / GT02V1 / F) TaxID=1149755 RepID=A0A2J6REV5_HYAVF|nr:hypothetical protein L207DRAFT_515481 [Hyaloscypha variabilis F]